MLRFVLNVISLWISIAFSVAIAPASAQSNACLIHDHTCIYHGVGRQVGTVPTTNSTISATNNWDQNNDLDLHLLLPSGQTYSDQQLALPFPLQPEAPFFPNDTAQHISPNLYGSTINGGAAIATHSGDDGGGLATRPDQPNCANQTGISCENITVMGDVPTGVYSYAVHAFPQSGTSFPETNYEVEIQATGNLVLVMEAEDQDNLSGSIIGAGSQSGRIDVFAINVGNSGHTGGIQLPEFEQYTMPNGVISYRPAEPASLAISQFSIQDAINDQFRQRDQYIGDLAYQRDVYLAELQKRKAEQEKLRLAKATAALSERLAPYQNNFCNPQYQYCGAPFAPNHSQTQLIQISSNQPEYLNNRTETAYSPTITEGRINDYTTFIDIDGERYRYTSDDAPFGAGFFNGAINLKEYVFKNPNQVAKDQFNVAGGAVAGIPEVAGDFSSFVVSGVDYVFVENPKVFVKTTGNLILGNGSLSDRLAENNHTINKARINSANNPISNTLANFGQDGTAYLDEGLETVTGGYYNSDSFGANAGKWISPLPPAAKGLGYLKKSKEVTKLGQKAPVSVKLDGIPKKTTLNIEGNICAYTCVVKGKTRYVGITNNIARRGVEHLRSKNIVIKEIRGLSNLSVSDARSVEQVLINYYGLGKKGGNLLNKINSISPISKPTIYEKSLIRGKELLDSVDYQWTK